MNKRRWILPNLTPCRRWWRIISTVPVPTLAQFGDIARVVRDLALVLAIAFYFSGWMYVNAFLQSLGLRLGDYEQPAYHVILYSFVPIVEAVYAPRVYALWWSQILVLLALPLLIARLAASARALSLYALVLYCLAVFIVLFRQADAVGRTHAEFLRTGGGKTIVLSFKDDYRQKAAADRYCRDLIDASDNKLLRLVWRTKEATYVLRLVDDGHSLHAVQTHEVRNDDLLITTVLQPPSLK